MMFLTNQLCSARRAAVALALALMLGACQPGIPLPFEQGAATSAPPAAPAQPVSLSGTMRYSNDLNLSYDSRAAVALVDLHGFVLRDADWRVPGDTLVFGRLRLDTDNQTGSYYLYLPAKPPGTFNDVDHDGTEDQGVKLFAVAFWEDPFGGHDRRAYGWPTDLASTIVDGEAQDEITGGRLVVWAPDAGQQFPSGFGDDERLFTDDDPLQPLPPGYSVIDLTARPFALDRALTPALKLYEESNYAIKDFANLSYSQALRRVFEELRNDYAFSGIAGKAPDWPALEAELLPRATRAEQDHDPAAFYQVMRDFALAFRDGHVNLDGDDLEDALFDRSFGGGYGLAVREADDARMLVVYVQPGGPAAQAGIVRGAELLALNGQPPGTALASIQPSGAPFSTAQALRMQQVRYLLRAPVGAAARLRFANPGSAPAEAALTAIDEYDSLDAVFAPEADPKALPIEYRVLASGLGYVRISSNSDDYDLTDELFWRALDAFEYHEVTGIIVDLRQNSGGSTQGFAGYLTDQEIELGRLEYYSRSTGAFEPDGPAETFAGSANPYQFAKLAVLVDQSCYSACELEAYGFSQLPGALVVGHFPTAGVVAEVSEGQFELPEGIWLQVPTGRYVRPDGQLFLEGAGVAPTLRVPLDAAALLDAGDPVLAAAERALLK